MSSFFITFEGLDGSGLSTQAKLLATALKKKKYSVVLTKEPSNSPVSKFIREQLKKGNVHTKWFQLFFVADRLHHTKNVILPALQKNKIVICDRYVLSSLAFGSLDQSIAWLKKANKGFPKANMTILLSVSPKVCMQRIKKSRGSFQLFEHEKMLQKVWKTYAALARKDKSITVLNGNKPAKKVASAVMKLVLRIIKRVKM